MENTWTIHGKYMGHRWEIHGKYMEHTREIHGKYMAHIWEIHGKYMGNTWESNGKYMEKSWKSNGKINKWTLFGKRNSKMCQSVEGPISLCLNLQISARGVISGGRGWMGNEKSLCLLIARSFFAFEMFEQRKNGRTQV